MQIIVARYNEDVRWANEFPNVLIVNKGNPLSLQTKHPVIHCPNVGREGHTFYKYIVENYDRLHESDFYLFLQGNPFDHTCNLKVELRQLLLLEEHGKLPKEKFMKLLSNQILLCSLENNSPFNDFYHPGLPLLSVFQTLFGQRKAAELKGSLFQFGAGGQFIVSRDFIVRRPKEFYCQIVDMLEKHVNPIEGYVIERLHPLLFIVEPPTTADTDLQS